MKKFLDYRREVVDEDAFNSLDPTGRSITALVRMVGDLAEEIETLESLCECFSAELKDANKSQQKVRELEKKIEKLLELDMDRVDMIALVAEKIQEHLKRIEKLEEDSGKLKKP